MERFLLVAVFCIIWTPFASAHSVWNYTDPGSWPGDCNLASSKKQTPINIETSAVTYDKDLGEFTLTNFDETPANTKFTALNNGHTLKISFPDKVYNVSGGGLTGVYTTAQFHLHWGSVNAQGSEHFMDGKKFAAELHFVNYNTKYPDISTAIDKTDGLAVLGVFIQVEGDNNTAYSFLDYAKDVVYKCDKKADIPAFKFKPMFPANLTKYYRYHGSLTTPDCYESVTWTVFKDVVKISQSQMDMLRMLKDASNKTLADNYRPIQQLNGRVVNSSFMESEPPTSDMTTVTSTPTDTSTVIPITADASAINMTAGLFLLMLFAAIFLR